MIKFQEVKTSCCWGLKYVDCIPCSKGKIPPKKECPEYETERHLTVRLLFWRYERVWNSPLLILLPGPRWLGVVVPVRVPSKGHIYLFKNYSHSMDRVHTHTHTHTHSLSLSLSLSPLSHTHTHTQFYKQLHKNCKYELYNKLNSRNTRHKNNSRCVDMPLKSIRQLINHSRSKFDATPRGLAKLKTLF